MKEINIKDFGAIGDGKNDDTYAIQKALDSISENEFSLIKIPLGNFLISKPILISDNTSIVGDGLGSILVLKAKKKIDAIIINRKKNTLTHNITISNLTIYGSKRFGSFTNGISLSGIYNTTLNNLKITDCSETGLEIKNSIKSNGNCYIKDCTIYSNDKHGLHIYNYSSDIHISYGNIGYNKLDNLLIESSSTSISNVKAIWGSIEGNGLVLKGDNIQINGCNIEGNALSGIYVYGNNNLISSGCKIYGNSIGKNQTKKNPGIAIDNLANNTAILGNQIYGDNYKESIDYCIKNYGNNTIILGNSFNVNPFNNSEINEPILSNKKVTTDFSWINTNIIATLVDPLTVNKFQTHILKFEPLENTENEFKNFTFTPKYKGLYKLSIILEIENMPIEKGLIVLKDNLNNIYYSDKNDNEIIYINSFIDCLDNIKSINFYIYSQKDLNLKAKRCKLYITKN